MNTESNSLPYSISWKIIKEKKQLEGSVAWKLTASNGSFEGIFIGIALRFNAMVTLREPMEDKKGACSSEDVVHSIP